MKDFKVGYDVFIWAINCHAVITAKFFYEDTIGFHKFDEKTLNKLYPLWKKKPIYLVTCYSGKECGERFIALHDVVYLTSDLN